MMEQAAPALQGSGSGLLPPPSPRQHSTPTYSEEVKAALAEFASQTPPTAVPPTLLRVVPDIAQTGLTCYEWPHLKVLVMFLLDQKLQEFNQMYPDIQAQFEQHRGRILSGLNNFTGVPFTIQRICEIVVRGEKSYRSTKKIVFALEKVPLYSLDLASLPQLVTISSMQETLGPQEYNQAVIHQQQAIANLPKNSASVARYPADEINSAPLPGTQLDTNSPLGGVATVMPRQGTPQVNDVAHASAAQPQRQEHPSDASAQEAAKPPAAQAQANGQPGGEAHAHPPSAMEVDQQGK